MRNPFKQILALTAIVFALALAGSPAFAVWSTNVWTTDGSGYSGDNNNTAHWVPAAMPGLVDQAWFTNQQPSAYTVKFQQSVTNGLVHVGTDKVTFDMNGKLWQLLPDATAPSTWVAGYHADSSQAIAGYAGENGAVTFSSSTAGTNTVLMRDLAANRAFWVGNTTGRGILNINTNLGYGVRLWIPDGAYYVGFQNATVNVDGPGAELRLDANYGQSINSTFNITGGGKMIAYTAAAFGNSGFGGGGGNTVNVSRAGILQTGGGNMSYYSLGNVWRITDGGTWNGGDVNMAYLNLGSPLPYGTDLLVDGTNTSVTLQGLKIGDQYDGVNYRANARATIQNGATFSVTNGIFVEAYTAAPTNTLILNNATLRLGGGTTAGWLTNRALVQASGTITGLGSSPALVRNEKRLDIGASLGTLTLNNAKLELAAGSQTFFEFSNTGLDQIAGNRSASLLGSNIFSLAAGAPAPVHGEKYGLGVYNFVIGTNVTWTPQYDNLVNLLTNTYHLTYGVDFQYGVVSLGGGLFALELAFVPEPSTVLLLLLGGWLVWRRMAKGRRPTRKGLGALIAGAVILALAGTTGFAQTYTTNAWIASGGNYSGDYNGTANWLLGSTPSQYQQITFTNQQAVAYTVQFTQSITNGPMNVGTDRVTFDMNGKLWYLTGTNTDWYGGNYPYVAQHIANGAGENATVTFSSSTAGSNTVMWTSYPAIGGYNDQNVGNTTGGAILNINTNLGYGATLWMNYGADILNFNHATVNVQGPGAVLRSDANYGSAGNSTLNVTDGGIVDASRGNNVTFFSNGGYTTVNVSRAGVLLTGNTQISYFSPGGVWNITNGGTWNGGDVNMAYLDVYANHSVANYDAELLVDGSNSTATIRSLKIGDLYDGVSYRANARATIQNGATLTVSNNLAITEGSAGSIYTNKFVLNNSTLRLGGILTNRALLQASGTITGIGASPALVRNEGRLDIGNSIGNLTLNNANLELAAGSANYFEFSATGLDQIVASNGYARILGTNLFSVIGPGPVHGVKYGLGVYNFVIGTSVTNATQYDNLVNVLTNNYHLTYGVDFTYGVVSLPGGLFALELMFVPEPSTVLLLALGGFLVWRRTAKGRRPTRKGLGTLIAGAVILALAGAPAFAVLTNTWTTDGSGYAGDYNNAAHFSPSLPGQYDQAWFTNQQSAAYKVTFQQGATNGILHVGTDQVTYDLNGKLWSLYPVVGGGWGNNDPAVSQNIAGQPGEVSLVNFSSSTPGTNTFRTGGGYANNFWVGNASGSAVLNINTNLGYGVKVWLTDGASMLGFNNATVNVQGPGAVLRVDANYGSAVNSTLNIMDGGVVDGTVGNTTTLFSGGFSDTVNVSRAGKLLTGNILVAYYFQGAVWNITDGGIWNGGDVNMANLTVYPNHPVIPYDGQLIVDGSNSIATLRSLRIGDPSGGYYANARVTIQNGATLAVTNGILVEAYTVAPTNYLSLNNATIRLGGGAVGGVLTNKALLRASGTITGMGSTPALVRNEKRLDIGSSIGTLTLNNANLQLAAGSENYFEFSATGLDQIVAPNGYATVLGTNRFSIIGVGPVPGVKYGLGVYDFVIGTGVTVNAQYDNLVNLLTNTYHLAYGVDFQYGVVNLGGGLFALELAFVPEPSTVLLLALGGLLVWRRMAKRGKTVASSR